MKFGIFWLLLSLYSSAWARLGLHKAKADDRDQIHTIPFQSTNPAALGEATAAPQGWVNS